MKQWMADSIRGKQSEERTSTVLKQLREEGLITGFRPTNKGSIDDCSGIDLYFQLAINGLRVEVPLQVKSSKFGTKVHKGKYGDIFCVNGQDPELGKHLIKIINVYKHVLTKESKPMATDSTKLPIPEQSVQQITSPRALREMVEGQNKIIELLGQLLTGMNNTQQILLTGLGRRVDASEPAEKKKLSGEALRTHRSETMKKAQAEMIERKRAEKVQKIKNAQKEYPTLSGNFKVISQLTGVGLTTIQKYHSEGLI